MVLFGFSASAQSQVTNTLRDALVKQGFENVAVKQEGKEVYVFFEDRRYRWDPEGIKEVFREAKSAIKDSSRIHLVPMHHRTPITIVSGNSYDSPNYTINFRTDSVKSFFREAKPKNSSLGKVDIILLPGFRVQFGNYDHPVEWQVSLSPILQTSLWKGMLLSAKLFVPLHSELQQKEENEIRLGTMAVNQLFRLPKDFFLNVSTGLFTYPVRISSSMSYQRYGVNADLRKYFLNSNLCTGASLGYTGQERFSNGVFDYWPMDRVTYALYGEYWEPRYNLKTKVTAGKFLYDDYAVRLDFSRQFKEVSIGFFALKSEFGYNGGFNFSIPISPRKQLKPAPARISVARYFNWEYAATTVHPSAATVETGYDPDARMRFLHENYLIHELH